MKIDDKEMTKIIKVIQSCDVILKNGYEHFVGLYYDNVLSDTPILVCKVCRDFNCFLEKIAEKLNVPCVEDKLLTQALYDTTKAGECIPYNFISPIAKLYGNLTRKGLWDGFYGKNFYAIKSKEIIKQIHLTIARGYNDVVREYFKKHQSCKKLSIMDIEGYVRDELNTLTQDNDFICQSFPLPNLQAKSFCLEMQLEECNCNFWQLIFIDEEEQQIHIATRAFFKTFDYAEADMAIGLIRELIKECKEKLKRAAIIYYEEFDINPKIYDIAQNSITAMLDLNYKENGIEYGFSTDTNVISIFLSEKSVQNGQARRMHVVCITYKEFLRNPTAFKDFIATPRRKRKWNFWCKERAYNQNWLEEKFQQDSLE